MKTSDFNFELPPELIAQDPLEDRSSSRLLVLDKETGERKMAYFKSNEPYPEQEYMPEEETEEEYDDGFDELNEEEYEDYPEISEEERREQQKSRYRLATGFGNLFGVIVGAILILVLITLISSMIRFVVTDMGRSFSLFSTNF